MMNKKLLSLVVVLFVSAFFLVSCSSDKEPAGAAIKAAETAINATKAEAVKLVPDQVKALDDSLAAAKEKFVKKDYKAALDEASMLPVRAKAVLASAKVKKEEFNKKWTEMSQELPKTIEEVQAKVDALSKVKRLPAKLTKEKFAEAQAAFASVKDDWTKAQESFKNANFTDALNMAGSLKGKLTNIMESLGMITPQPKS
jgi:hypothetical protein